MMGRVRYRDSKLIISKKNYSALLVKKLVLRLKFKELVPKKIDIS